MVVLDTDHVTLLSWPGGPATVRLQARLTSASKQQVAVAIVTYEEQVRGWLSLVARAKTVTEQIAAYRRLGNHLNYFCGIDVLPFDEAAAVHFQRLRSLKLGVGTMDLKIAAIALANNATVLTRNLVDFRRVPGLTIEDWTA